MDVATTGKLSPYKLISIFSQVMSIICIFIALCMLVPYVAKYLHGGTLEKIVAFCLHVEQTLRGGLRAAMKTTVAGIDLSRFVVLAIALFLSGVFSDLNQRCRYKITYHRLKEEFASFTQMRKPAGGDHKFAEYEQKLEQIKTASKKDRDQLLKNMIEIKKELETFGRDMAFLSIDVVDSTGMKANQDPNLVEYDFKQFRQLLENKLTNNGCVKWSWTGDGLMACFNTVNASLKAAQEIIRDLSIVNKTRNITQEFAVRCGINAGYVYFDESKPLEQIADRVIDIAGHMQKYAERNTICIAKNVIEPVSDITGFLPANRLIDGYEAYEWKS